MILCKGVFLDKDKLICSICLDLQKDPVTIPCGHSYCLECIQNFWSGEEPKAPSCPQCRQSFTSRPVLVRNTILAELVEDARKADLCSMDEHKGHDMVSAAAERAERQTKLGLDQQKVQQRILNLEEDLEVLQQAVEAINLSETLTDQTTKISDSVDVFLPEDFRSREDFMKFYHQITLDPNTANRNVSLSEQNRTATWTMIKQNYSSHPDRFAERSQVLSAEGLTGCCYWEVEWSGGVFIAVAYKDRSGAGTWDESVFGFNDKSWALRCSNTEYTFYHNNRCVSIAAPRSSRVGVYLNHKAGSLSFYSVSDSMTLLHKVQTTFTQTLYAGFWMSKSGSMIRLLK
uniref:Tripartite motif-containing protein 16-like n=1 Tax=Oryzias sinensis TaxID=183150 RepID=A0A8C7Y8T9_9TELE